MCETPNGFLKPSKKVKKKIVRPPWIDNLLEMSQSQGLFAEWGNEREFQIRQIELDIRGFCILHYIYILSNLSDIVKTQWRINY
jgi:hypothetical protein